MKTVLGAFTGGVMVHPRAQGGMLLSKHRQLGPATPLQSADVASGFMLAIALATGRPRRLGHQCQLANVVQPASPMTNGPSTQLTMQLVH